ncbi:tRNA glutamyl-Q(34) synthetase GluQRS [Tessaracoccus caeni]|uniref:tRNA glutamyl-Q(34) synthetase GluQRS n=1 Tax=Tessaracoccus caeni TaxID=3031239 RepID=UPI0023DC045D|nr:tRNA glutamyl-Q(34) synthetase GluQRS [Tessaracoccus caeni]MDF1488013.1 tRNA glutamyl-Q(34) synthetase GluQRS [Tessaracoccus caeni]
MISRFINRSDFALVIVAAHLLPHGQATRWHHGRMHIDRYAPSPTSDLHLGNLRTAVAGWLAARRSGGRWLMRVEDLDAARVRAFRAGAASQLADLAELGLDFDGEVVLQSERLDLYRDAIASLEEDTYECYCTRREIAEAASAPHDDGYRPYPGTCRDLSAAERQRRRAERPAAIRVRADGVTWRVTDAFAGDVSGVVDDFVLVRGDGQAAYNLAVVVDDLAMGVTHVTRGDDLLSSAPRQAWLATRLGGTPPRYAHAGLVVNEKGVRLAKRDGAVTLAELHARGLSSSDVMALLCGSLRLGPCRTPDEALAAMPGAYPPDMARGAVWDGATLQVR